jgi:hypothetical protein
MQLRSARHVQARGLHARSKAARSPQVAAYSCNATVESQYRGAPLPKQCNSHNQCHNAGSHENGPVLDVDRSWPYVLTKLHNIGLSRPFNPRFCNRLMTSPIGLYCLPWTIGTRQIVRHEPNMIWLVTCAALEYTHVWFSESETELLSMSVIGTMAVVVTSPWVTYPIPAHPVLRHMIDRMPL